MYKRNRRMIGLLATTVALAAGPGASSAMANWSVSDATTTEGGNLAFTITANCENGIFPCIDERFSYAIEGGSAKVGADLPAAASGVLLSSIPWGTNNRVIEVPTTDDSIDEPDSEQVTLRVSHSGKFGAAERVATGTIRDNDTEPQVSAVAAPATINEGTGGSRSVPFTIRLAAPSEQALTRSYGTEDGTAKAGQDYTSASGSLVFQPGETQKVVDVPVTTDSVDENDETFRLLSGSADALVTILDDDLTPEPTPGPGSGGGSNPATPGAQSQPVTTQGGPTPSATAIVPVAKSKVKAKAKAKRCGKGKVRKGKGAKAKCVRKKARGRKAKGRR